MESSLDSASCGPLTEGATVERVFEMRRVDDGSGIAATAQVVVTLAANEQIVSRLSALTASDRRQARLCLFGVDLPIEMVESSGRTITVTSSRAADAAKVKMVWRMYGAPFGRVVISQGNEEGSVPTHDGTKLVFRVHSNVGPLASDPPATSIKGADYAWRWTGPNSIDLVVEPLHTDDFRPADAFRPLRPWSFFFEWTSLTVLLGFVVGSLVAYWRRRPRRIYIARALSAIVLVYTAGFLDGFASTSIVLTAVLSVSVAFLASLVPGTKWREVCWWVMLSMIGFLAVPIVTGFTQSLGVEYSAPWNARELAFEFGWAVIGYLLIRWFSDWAAAAIPRRESGRCEQRSVTDRLGPLLILHLPRWAYLSGAALVIGQRIGRFFTSDRILYGGNGPILVLPYLLIACALSLILTLGRRRYFSSTTITVAVAWACGVYLSEVAVGGFRIPVSAIALIVILPLVVRRKGGQPRLDYLHDAIDARRMATSESYWDRVARWRFESRMGPFYSRPDKPAQLHVAECMRLAVLLSSPVVAYVLWTTVRGLSVTEWSPGSIAFAIAAVVAELARWVVSGWVYAALVDRLPGRFRPVRGLVLSLLLLASVLASVVLAYAAGEGELVERSWFGPVFTSMLVFIALGAVLDYRDLKASDPVASWREISIQLGQVYRMKSMRSILVVGVPVVLAITALIQQVLSGSISDVFTSILEAAESIPAQEG